MSDVELAHALERGHVPGERFHHVDHLRVALVYLNEAPGVDAAIARFGTTLRRFAASVGRVEKYSQRTTEFWMYQLAAARALLPGASADAIFRACPCLLDKNLVDAFCSRDAAQTGAAASPGDA